MASEREALLRGLFARLNATGDAGFNNLDPEIEWHLRADLPDSRTLRGHDQVRELYADWTGAFEDLQLEPIEVSEVAGKTEFVFVPLPRPRQR